MARERTRQGQLLLFQHPGEAARVQHFTRSVLTTSSPAGRRILIVEDSSLVVDALRVLLEEHGHEVAIADSVASARERAEEVRPDIVLLDVALPDGDGLELVRLWGGSDAPAVLALTGHADDETRRRCLDAGCREVLVKPVPTAVLLERIGRNSD